MHAHLTPCHVPLDRCAEMERLVADRLIPALRSVPGCAGALNLVDRATGSLLLIALWESPTSAARPPGEHGDDIAAAFAELEALSTGERRPPSVWEVGARV
jgi:hypothetical protein